jgi:hypothetical protein
VATRIRNQWHKDKRARSTEEVAGAIAFNSWKLAMDKAINLQNENFRYSSGEQQMDVLSEYLIFQVQIIERLSHDRLDDEQRRQLITAVVMRLADHIQDNSAETFGVGDYRSPFIEKFNQRAAEYSELGFSDQGPSYPFLRHLGYQVQCVMGESQENRWVIDQVMDKDGPEVYKQLRNATRHML